MSNGGEFFTRFTIWIALALYSVGVVLWALSRKEEGRERAARLVWTIACISLLSHVACAFQFYHHVVTFQLMKRRRVKRLRLLASIGAADSTSIMR